MNEWRRRIFFFFFRSFFLQFFVAFAFDYERKWKRRKITISFHHRDNIKNSFIYEWIFSNWIFIVYTLFFSYSFRCCWNVSFKCRQSRHRKIKLLFRYTENRIAFQCMWNGRKIRNWQRNDKNEKRQRKKTKKKKWSKYEWVCMRF